MESPLLGPSGAPNVILRIVNIEYYLAPPIPEVDACWSSLEGSPVTHVPVVRIYGSTPQGQKACLHVHQVGMEPAEGEDVATASSTSCRHYEAVCTCQPSHPPHRHSLTFMCPTMKTFPRMQMEVGNRV